MTLSATDIGNTAQTTRDGGPVVEKTRWGYAIRDPRPDSALRAIVSGFGRFAGTILLMTAGGLLILPDGAHGAGIAGMKLAAMVMFTVIGLYLFFAGGDTRHPEIHVDTSRAEVRVGRRGAKGEFHRSATLDFRDIASVYLLRTKDHSQPTRLFLRITGSDAALEVASGPEAALEALRETLTRALVMAPRRPIEQQLRRHTNVAA